MYSTMMMKRGNKEKRKKEKEHAAVVFVRVSVCLFSTQ